jgi:heme oxygenase (mycobilin-producing)
MITRIVKMYFNETTAPQFLAVFERHKIAIRNFSGCSQLQLVKEMDVPFCYCTVSRWDSLESLENYRNSALFIEVWREVKPLFIRKTDAFSLEDFITIGKF